MKLNLRFDDYVTTAYCFIFILTQSDMGRMFKLILLGKTKYFLQLCHMCQPSKAVIYAKRRVSPLFIFNFFNVELCAHCGTILFLQVHIVIV